MKLRIFAQVAVVVIETVLTPVKLAMPFGVLDVPSPSIPFASIAFASTAARSLRTICSIAGLAFNSVRRV